MKILALELSSAQGSIALREDGTERFAREFPNDRKHSGLFFENLQRCIEQFGQPARIVVGLGPGSHAGTRIAIAAATGLQAASGAELIGVASFCALPVEASEYAVLGDARRQSFWLAQVKDRRSPEGPVLCTQEELSARLEGMDVPLFAAERLAVFPQAVVSYPSAIVLAQLSASEQTSPLEPIYLHEPHITKPKTA